MARKARVKIPNSIYHIMARSIIEIDLFQDKKDKEKYLELIKEYQIIHNFKIYGYCLMDNHIHLMMDPNGADISKIMHCIDTAYARYFNKRHGRRGHLFEDRFKSKIVMNERNLKILSIYIHNNPRAMKRFKTKPEKYFYSSLGIYVGKLEDKYGLVDTSVVLSRFGEKKCEAVKNYKNVIFKERDNKILDEDSMFKNNEEDEKYEFIRKNRIRNKKFEDVLNCVIQNYFKTEESYNINELNTGIKSMIVVVAKRFCEISGKKLAEKLGEISETRISQLSKIGCKRIANNSDYNRYFKEIEAKLEMAN